MKEPMQPKASSCPHPFERTRETHPVWVALFLLGLFALAWFISLKMARNSGSDIGIHAAWAAECSFLHPKTFFRHGAHPLWHVMVSLLLLVGMPLDYAAALITALSKTLEGYLVYRLFRQRVKFHTLLLLLMSLICVTVACIRIKDYNMVVYFANPNNKTTYSLGTPNTWHSCTQYLAQVFMLVCVPYAAHLYDRFENELPLQGENSNIPKKEGIFFGTLLIGSLLAKPTFMQAFLPAACLFFLYQWIRHPKNSRFFVRVLLCVLPSILMMIAQYLYYFTNTVVEQGGMVFSLTPNKLKITLAGAAMMRIFPWATLLMTRKKPLNTFEKLTLAYDAVAIVEYVLLGEGGPRADDGNFGWGMMGAALMLWVVTLIRYAHLWEEKLPTGQPKCRLCQIGHRVMGLLLMAWHWYGGIYYLCFLFQTTRAL